MHSVPFTRDLVLVGGGHAHALVLRRWGMDPLPGVRVTLISPEPTAPYTGMLPGHLAGHYERDALDIDLVRLARFAGARLILDRAVGLDRGAGRVHLAGRPPVAYDALSLDIGITSDMPDLPGFADTVVAAKPLGPLARAWARYADDVARGEVAASAAVIGGGVGGVEIGMALAHRLRAIGIEDPRVSIIDAGEGPGGVSAGARATIADRLGRAGITWRTKTRVTGLERGTPEHTVHLNTNDQIIAGFVAGAGGARPQDWLQETGLALHQGYLAVDPSLRVLNEDAIFAAGDCAHFSHAPRPKAGVYAVRAAPILHDNLRAVLSGGKLRSYHPQSDFLKLISLGEQSAVADKAGLRLQGRWLWHLKDWIDRRFMDRLTDLPAMAPTPLPKPAALGVAEAHKASEMLCGGCGAKVGPSALGSILETLPPPAREDVVSGPGDDAALLSVGGARQVITTDHLRAFTEDPWLLARIASVHAMGDVWAMGAAPQAALVTVILPQMIPALQRETMREVMAGIQQSVGEAGADIVGGHSAIGTELSIGLTVTGLAGPGSVTGGRARPGNVLILTKPIGTGTILGGEMAPEGRGILRGQWVAGAYDAMLQAQGEAAKILAPHALAMTDVTGFGLAGHLLSLLDASTVGARIVFDDIPLLDGAADLCRAGVRSSLYRDNETQGARVEILRPATDREDLPLLFDPQTSGGLLAAIPAPQATLCLGRLREAGYRAAQIGEITGGAPQLEVY